EMVGRANFSSLTPAYPVERIMLSRGCNSPAFALIDLFIPLAFGQRAVILSPAHGGKTTLIKEIASGISAGYPQAVVIILQLCAKPEELTDFKRAFPQAVRFTTGFCAGVDENTEVANLAFEHAKRLAELGKDAVILADGLVSACGAETVKRLFSGVCNTEEGGTVTAVVTLSDSGAEEVVSAANAVITISEELSAARIYPAVDVKKSYAYREENLLSKDALSAANALRSKFSARDIVRLVNDNPDADSITENYKNG
ncbi:MAG: hypothetical protein K2K80_06175, partial [Clostridia bacterium]|nr:hypothetical protein [Clostridia bacterium]